MKVSLILPYYNRKELIRLTLDSLQFFYRGRNDFEIVIVDDGSCVEHRIESLVRGYDLDIQLVRISNKKGYNPSYPYNVGVRKSSGDVIMLSSPETFHTTNIFDIDWNRINDSTYFQFSVFSLIDKEIKKSILEADSFDNVLKIIQSIKAGFYEGLGLEGYSFHNSLGSWYTHSTIRPSCLNFFSSLTRKNFYKLCGFDERFVKGTGYDDEEFKNRLLRVVDNVIWHDNVLAIHMDHEIVGNLPPTTNHSLFQKVSVEGYPCNDRWGML